MTGDGIRPNKAISAVRRAIENSGNLSTDVSYVEKEPDLSGSESNVNLPLVTVQPVSEIRITNFNTDRVGYVTDSSGNHTGRVFTAEYRLDLQIDVWSASESSFDAGDLGDKVWDSLYPHDSASASQPFLDGNGSPIESIWRVRIGDGQPAHDLTMTPAVRRWRQDITLWAYHRFDTSEDYVKSVNMPSDGSFDDSDGDGVIEN